MPKVIQCSFCNRVRIEGDMIRFFTNDIAVKENNQHPATICQFCAAYFMQMMKARIMEVRE